MTFAKWFRQDPIEVGEIRIVRPQKVLVAFGSGWRERVLHKGDDGTLWVHGSDDLEWLELGPDFTVKAPDAVLQQLAGGPRRWRHMPGMLDHPFVTVRRAED